MTDVAAPRRSSLVLIVFALACAAAASMGAAFPPGEWFASLAKPSWNPPSWLFAPVWTTLYAMIAAAGWLAWRGAPGRRAARVIGIAWSVQMILNAAWTPLFFGLHRPMFALGDIGLLFFAIIACIPILARGSRLAAYLFVPYAIWVSFAGMLNATIWWMNRPV